MRRKFFKKRIGIAFFLCFFLALSFFFFREEGKGREREAIKRLCPLPKELPFKRGKRREATEKNMENIFVIKIFPILPPTPTISLMHICIRKNGRRRFWAPSYIFMEEALCPAVKMLWISIPIFWNG